MMKGIEIIMIKRIRTMTKGMKTITIKGIRMILIIRIRIAMMKRIKITMEGNKDNDKRNNTKI